MHPPIRATALIGLDEDIITPSSQAGRLTFIGDLRFGLILCNAFITHQKRVKSWVCRLVLAVIRIDPVVMGTHFRSQLQRAPREAATSIGVANYGNHWFPSSTKKVDGNCLWIRLKILRLQAQSYIVTCRRMHARTVGFRSGVDPHHNQRYPGAERLTALR